MRFLFQFNPYEVDFFTAHNAAQKGNLIEGHDYKAVAQFDDWVSDNEIFDRAGNNPAHAEEWHRQGFKVRSMSVGDFIYDPGSETITLCKPMGFSSWGGKRDFVHSEVPRYALRLDEGRIEAMQTRLRFLGQESRGVKDFAFNLLHPDGQFYRLLNVRAKDEHESEQAAELMLALEISKMGMPLILSD